jgi:hypothetical protein
MTAPSRPAPVSRRPSAIPRGQPRRRARTGIQSLDGTDTPPADRPRGRPGLARLRQARRAGLPRRARRLRPRLARRLVAHRPRAGRAGVEHPPRVRRARARPRRPAGGQRAARLCLPDHRLHPQPARGRRALARPGGRSHPPALPARPGPRRDLRHRRPVAAHHLAPAPAPLPAGAAARPAGAPRRLPARRRRPLGDRGGPRRRDRDGRRPGGRPAGPAPVDRRGPRPTCRPPAGALRPGRVAHRRAALRRRRGPRRDARRRPGHPARPLRRGAGHLLPGPGPGPRRGHLPAPGGGAPPQRPTGSGAPG